MITEKDVLLAEHATNDLLALRSAQRRKALRAFVQRLNATEEASGDEAATGDEAWDDTGLLDVEDFRDPAGGWSFMRVGNLLFAYRALTDQQLRQLAERGSLRGRYLVSGIWRI